MSINISSKKIEYFLSFGLLLFVIIIAYIHATQGISFTDEAYYIATPYHLANGGRLFIDEFLNATHQFDMVISPVFLLIPKLTLFQFRMIGSFIYLSSLLFLFAFLARRGNVLLIATGCTLAFLFNNFGGISSPSYNMLSSSLSLFGLVCWLWSVEMRSKMGKWVLAVLSGTFLALMIASYLPLALLIIAPVITLVLAIISNKSFKQYIIPTTIVIFTVCILLSSILIGLIFSGRFPGYIENFEDIASTMVLADHGIVKRITIIFEAVTQLLDSLALLSIGFGIFIFSLNNKFVSQKCRAVFFIGGAMGFLLFFYFALYQNPFQLIMIPLVFICSVIALQILFRSHKRSVQIYILMIFWGIFHSVLYLIFSSNVLVSAKQGFMALLTVVPIVLVAQLETTNIQRKRYVSILLTIIFSLCIVVGAQFYLDSIYGERKPYNLSYSFSHEKLINITTTPEKGFPLEKLLLYLKKKVEPGDYFLAYNDMPLLYYLTDTKPIYNTVWSIDNYWPYSLKRKLTEKMIQDGKESQYAVRLAASPDSLIYMPNAPNLNDYRMPLDDYVKRHYYLETVIFPYEVWKRGDKPVDYFFTQKEPVYEESYSKSSSLLIFEPFTTDITALAFLPTNGFIFNSEVTRDSVLRVSAQKSTESNNRSVRFGYFSSVPELSKYLHKGNQVIFMVKARVSGKKNNNSRYPAVMYVKSKLNENRVSIYKREWELYEVAKYIEEEGEQLDIGIIWQPYFENDTIEIKEMKIFVQ